MTAYIALFISILAFGVSILSYRLSRAKQQHDLDADVMQARGALYDLVMLVVGQDAPPKIVAELSPYTRWDDTRFDKLYEDVARGLPAAASALFPLRTHVATLYSLATARTGQYAVWNTPDIVAWSDARRGLRHGLRQFAPDFGIEYPWETE